MKIIVKQDTILGGNSDGSRDGLVYLNQDPSSWHSDVVTVSDIGPGFLLKGVQKADVHMWLRFAIPLAYDADIVIDSVVLKLWWNAPPNANVGLIDNGEGGNLESPLQLDMKVYDNGGASPPIPATAAAYTSTLLNVSVPSHQIGALDGHWIHRDPGQFVEPVYETNTQLAVLFRVNYEAGLWAEDNIMAFGFNPTDFIDVQSRYVRFRTWSWLKQQINLGNLASEAIETAPQLIINYSYTTPGNTLGRHVEHVLTLSQTFAETGFRVQVVEHELDITQEITITQDYGKEVEHFLLIQDTVTGELSSSLNQEIEHFLIFDQTIDHDLTTNYTVEHALDIQQEYSFSMGLNQQVVHRLDIENDVVQGNKSYEQEIVQSINFTQEIDQSGVHTKSIEHVLGISHFFTLDDSSTIQSPHHVEHTLSITQFILDQSGPQTANTVRSPVISGKNVTGGQHDLNLSQSFTGIITRNGVDITTVPNSAIRYAPSGDDNEAFPLQPSITATGTFILKYPKVTPTNTITLPAPVFGNKDELHHQRIQRKTRGGVLKTYLDASWNETEIFRYKFQDLQDSEVLDFFTFIAVSLGQEIEITDHEGTVRCGVIINPNGESLDFFRQCGKTVEFDFQVSPQ